MKTYNEVVDSLAKNMFNKYMGGGYPQPSSCDIVGFIFGATPNTVDRAVRERFEAIQKEYYSKQKAK